MIKPRIGPNQGYCGVVQLRCKNPGRLDEVAMALDNSLEGADVSKIVKMKDGIDFYMATKNKLNRLAKQLPRRFGGIVKLSSKLITKNRMTSKEVRRLNVGFHIFPFSSGQVVLRENTPVLLTKLSNRIHGKNLATGKSLSFVFDPKEKLELLEPMEAHVSQYRPVLKVIHPVSFQPVKLLNLKFTALKSLKVVAIDDSLYYLK